MVPTPALTPVDVARRRMPKSAARLEINSFSSASSLHDPLKVGSLHKIMGSWTGSWRLQVPPSNKNSERFLGLGPFHPARFPGTLEASLHAVRLQRQGEGLRGEAEGRERGQAQGAT